MSETKKENDLIADEDEPITLSELYAKYELDERGQRYFGQYVTVWRNASVLSMRRSKRTLWSNRRVSNDQGWLILMCGQDYEAVPPLTVPDGEQLQSDLAEAIAFCEANP